MYNRDNITCTYIKAKRETLKQRFAIEKINYDKKEVNHMQTKMKQSIVIITIILSYIVSSGIKAALNFDYTPFRDGVGIKLLLDFGLYVSVFSVIYYLTSRLLSKLSHFIKIEWGAYSTGEKPLWQSGGVTSLRIQCSDITGKGENKSILEKNVVLF